MENYIRFNNDIAFNNNIEFRVRPYTYLINNGFIDLYNKVVLEKEISENWYKLAQLQLENVAALFRSKWVASFSAVYGLTSLFNLTDDGMWDINEEQAYNWQKAFEESETIKIYQKDNGMWRRLKNLPIIYFKNNEWRQTAVLGEDGQIPVFENEGNNIELVLGDLDKIVNYNGEKLTIDLVLNAIKSVFPNAYKMQDIIILPGTGKLPFDSICQALSDVLITGYGPFYQPNSDDLTYVPNSFYELDRGPLDYFPVHLQEYSKLIVTNAEGFINYGISTDDVCAVVTTGWDDYAKSLLDKMSISDGTESENANVVTYLTQSDSLFEKYPNYFVYETVDFAEYYTSDIIGYDEYANIISLPKYLDDELSQNIDYQIDFPTVDGVTLDYDKWLKINNRDISDVNINIVRNENYYKELAKELQEYFYAPTSITNTIQTSSAKKIINLQIREKYYKPTIDTVWQINSKDVVNAVSSGNNGMYPTVKANLYYNYTVPIPDSVYNGVDLNPYDPSEK